MIEHQDNAAGGAHWRAAVEARRHGMRLEVVPRRSIPLTGAIVWILLIGIFAAAWVAIWEIWMVAGFADDHLQRYLMRALGIAPAIIAIAAPLIIWSFLQRREHRRGPILLIDQAAREITLPRYERSWPLSSVQRVGINKGWHIRQGHPGHTSFTSERWLTVVIREGENDRMYRVGRNLSARGGMKRVASMIAEAAGCPLDDSLLRTTIDRENADGAQPERQVARGYNAARVVAVIFMALGALPFVWFIRHFRGQSLGRRPGS